MNSFLTYQSLIEFGVPPTTIKDGVNRYRKGKSSSWANLKDPSDKRKVLIDINTIPNQTRLKYGIVIKEPSIVKQERKEHVFTSLHRALEDDYSKYINKYKRTTSDQCKVIDLAKLHAVYVALIELIGKEKATRGQLKEVFEVYLTLPPFKGKVLTKPTFSRNLTKAKKDIKSTVLHGRQGIGANIKINDFHKSIIMIYATQPNIYSARVVCDMVNFECENKKIPTISLSSVERFLAKSENKTLIEKLRYGSTSYENNIQPFLHRSREKFAGDLWVMDGTPTQFYFWDETKKGLKRLNLYVIIDAFSGKIVGYDVSISEDRFNVLNALKMAFKVHGHIPTEILHDNFSANKTDEIKTIKENLELLGCSFRAARVGNAKDKTSVERFFGTLQTTIQKHYDDYLGEGITSKRKTGRADKDFIKKAVKQRRLTQDDLKHRLAVQIEQYNNLGIKKASPTSRYSVSPKPNVKELDQTQVPFLFWYRKTITIKNSMVKTTIKGVEYFYSIPTNELKFNLNKRKVDLFYDEKDLDTVHLFEVGTDRPICECKRSIGPTASQVGRSEKDDIKILSHHAKNKSYDKFLDDKLHETISKGLKHVGLSEFTPTDPLSTEKYNQNDAESRALTEYFFQENQIDPKEHDLLKNQVKRPTYRVNKIVDEDELLSINIKKKPFKIHKPKGSKE